jgi:putative phosphoribosyl transferase
MMYFKNRESAADLLIQELSHYSDDNQVVVLTISSGGLGIADRVSSSIGAKYYYFKSKVIMLPGENIPVGAVGQNGEFTRNPKISESEFNSLNEEYHSVIDQECLSKISEISQSRSEGPEITKDLLREKVVIITTDGIFSSVELAPVLKMLQSISIKRLVVAIPIASVEVVDLLHISCDEMHILSVVEPGFELDHYFEDEVENERSLVSKKIF